MRRTTRIVLSLLLIGSTWAINKSASAIGSTWEIGKFDSASEIPEAGGANATTLATTLGSIDAAIKYVSLSGIDSIHLLFTNDCRSTVLPCETIEHAIEQANSGDRIHVAAGDYDAPRVVVSKLSGTATFIGSNGSNFTVDART